MARLGAVVEKAAEGLNEVEKELLTTEVDESRAAELADDAEFFAGKGAQAAKEAEARVRGLAKVVRKWMR